jgi:hypothetical protein
MHPAAHIVLSGIEACRRCLRQHPGQPVKAVNRRFDFAETAPAAGPGSPADAGARRWVELRPHSAGVAIQIVTGTRRALAESLLYPATPESAGADRPWLGIDPAAIIAPPFLTQLAAAAARALEQLDSFPEPLHG